MQGKSLLELVQSLIGIPQRLERFCLSHPMLDLFLDRQSLLQESYSPLRLG